MVEPLRSLEMRYAGELLVIIAEKPSLGAQLEFARQFAKAPQLLATVAQAGYA